MLPLGRISIAEVAQTVGMNVRTLQRRLAAEDTQFSDLVDRVRRDLAVRYLANPNTSMSEISRLLGYDRLSSFTRWFSSEFGVAPSRWRTRDPLPSD